MENKIILLVEDNPDDVRLTKRAFSENGILNELMVMTDGATALEYLIRSATQPGGVLPTIILLDLNLPRMGGLDLLQCIRAHPRLKQLLVIVLTSSTEQIDVIRSYDLGANSYIQKPVGFEDFKTAVRQLGLYWLLLNEPPPLPN